MNLDNPVKIGLFGLGCVGQALYEVLGQTQGVQTEITKICVKDPKKERKVDSNLITFNPDDILNDDEIDVVVELIDDSQAAFDIISTTLKKGKAAISANKKMIAENFEELFKLQNSNAPFLYEASSCASIPLIRNLEEYYDNDLLTGIEGIFNGSTNYILSKIFQENIDYQVALKQAQDAGFAETNPSLDTAGYDPKFKLCIVLAHSFGVFVKPEQVFNYGIENLSSFDIRFAKEKNLKIKLLAKCERRGDSILAYVAPTFVPQNNVLYNIENEFNGVVIEGAFSEHQFFLGKGAGGYPTASAVLSDISARTYDYHYEYKKKSQNSHLFISDEFEVDIFVRAKDLKQIKQDDFSSIYETFKSQEQCYMTGKILLSKLRNSSWVFDDNMGIIFCPPQN